MTKSRQCYSTYNGAWNNYFDYYLVPWKATAFHNYTSVESERTWMFLFNGFLEKCLIYLFVIYVWPKRFLHIYITVVSALCYYEMQSKTWNNLNVAPVNTRTLPKYYSELFCLLSVLNTRFDTVIFTEIWAFNITNVSSFVVGYHFEFSVPESNI